MNGAGRWRGRAAAALLAIYGALALPGAIAKTALTLRDGFERRRESLEAARARVFGPDYAAGIERARAAIPIQGEYLLFDAGRVEEGALNWVRYDLAPRRAVSGGPIERLGRPERVRRRIERSPAICVVARPRVAPLVMSQDEFVAWLARGAGDA
jgi:hypothetical protein